MLVQSRAVQQEGHGPAENLCGLPQFSVGGFNGLALGLPSLAGCSFKLLLPGNVLGKTFDDGAAAQVLGHNLLAFAAFEVKVCSAVTLFPSHVCYTLELAPLAPGSAAVVNVITPTHSRHATSSCGAGAGQPRRARAMLTMDARG